MESGTQRPSRPTIVSLLGSILDQARMLLLQEVALTKLELRYEMDRARSAAIVLAIGTATLTLGGLLLVLMLVHGLAAMTPIPLWGCYGVVGGLLFLLGLAFLNAGRSKAAELATDATHTVERLKESVLWLTKQPTFDRR